MRRKSKAAPGRWTRQEGRRTLGSASLSLPRDGRYQGWRRRERGRPPRLLTRGAEEWPRSALQGEGRGWDKEGGIQTGRPSSPGGAPRGFGQAPHSLWGRSRRDHGLRKPAGSALTPSSGRRRPALRGPALPSRCPQPDPSWATPQQDTSHEPMTSLQCPTNSLLFLPTADTVNPFQISVPCYLRNLSTSPLFAYF